MCIVFAIGGDLRNILYHSKISDPVLGWVSFRPGPGTNPTMREMMVTHALPTALQSLKQWQVQIPTILCLLNLGKDHHDATFSFGYRMYIPPSVGDLPGPLRAIPVQVLNVGAHQSKHRWALRTWCHPLRISPLLYWVLCRVFCSISKHWSWWRILCTRYDSLWPLPHMEHADNCGPGWEHTSRILSSISLVPQIHQMEDAYNSSLQELKSLIESAQRSHSYLQGLIAETEELSTKNSMD